MKKKIDFSEYLREKSLNGIYAEHFDAPAAKERNILGTRLSAARKSRGLNQQQLCDLLARYGVQIRKAALSKWETGESVPNAYQLFAICHALRIEDGLSYFTGKVDLNPIGNDSLTENLNAAGQKALAQFADFLVSTGKYRPTEPAAPSIVFRDFPTYPIGASAGPGQFLDDSYAEMKSFPADSIPADADFAVRVVGTSMEPVFMDGQYVFVQKCGHLENGEVGIFEWNGESYIKVYREQFPGSGVEIGSSSGTDPDSDDPTKQPSSLEDFTDEDGHLHPEILLISYNTANGANPPKRIRPADSFHIFGRVLRA